MAKPDLLRQKIIEYKETFATPSGEKVLEDLSRQLYLTSSTFVDNNPYGSAFNEGKRWVILHITKMLSLDPNDPDLLKKVQNG